MYVVQHGGIQHARLYPGGRSSLGSKFGCPREVSRYFQVHLADLAESAAATTTWPAPPVRYYVAQEEVWKTPATFPVPNQHPGGATLVRFLLDPSTVTIYPSSTRSSAKGSFGGRGSSLRRNSLDASLSSSLRVASEVNPHSHRGKMTLPVDIHRSWSMKGVSRYQAMVRSGGLSSLVVR